MAFVVGTDGLLEFFKDKTEKKTFQCHFWLGLKISKSLKESGVFSDLPTSRRTHTVKEP